MRRTNNNKNKNINTAATIAETKKTPKFRRTLFILNQLRRSRFIAFGLVLVITCLLYAGFIEFYLRFVLVGSGQSNNCKNYNSIKITTTPTATTTSTSTTTSSSTSATTTTSATTPVKPCTKVKSKNENTLKNYKMPCNNNSEIKSPNSNVISEPSPVPSVESSPTTAPDANKFENENEIENFNNSNSTAVDTLDESDSELPSLNESDLDEEYPSSLNTIESLSNTINLGSSNSVEVLFSDGDEIISLDPVGVNFLDYVKMVSSDSVEVEVEVNSLYKAEVTFEEIPSDSIEKDNAPPDLVTHTSPLEPPLNSNPLTHSNTNSDTTSNADTNTNCSLNAEIDDKKVTLLTESEVQKILIKKHGHILSNSQEGSNDENKFSVNEFAQVISYFWKEHENFELVEKKVDSFVNHQSNSNTTKPDYSDLDPEVSEQETTSENPFKLESESKPIDFTDPYH